MTCKSSISPLSSRNESDARSRGVEDILAGQAAKTPDAPALTAGSLRLSYRELNQRANRLAHFLREQGTAPGALVGVFLDRSIETVISLVAILKAGGVYVPLDPAFPKGRLQFMLADAEVHLLLTQKRAAPSLPETNARVVIVDDLETSLAGYPTCDPLPMAKPADLAYLIYTSGSTGNPKGVMIERHSLMNFLLSMVERPKIDSSDVLLAVTTVSFDISILELLLPLTIGAQVVIATREESSDPNELQKLLDAHGITVMQATPTTWQMLLKNGWQGKRDLKILCGGEALTPDLTKYLLPRCRELWNLYGPTETTIWSSTERITGPNAISLGAPIANTQFYVVDENLRPVEPDETGELLIGGDGLARGYLKRPDQTELRFIPGFSPSVQGDRLYRTGDVVRRRNDGSLEYLGRLDNQVKLNGVRIELGEIETALACFEGIRQAVVALRETPEGSKRLVAYYTGRQEFTSSLLIQALKQSLPEYMVPAIFVHLLEFPRTPNGKLDRKALPSPAQQRPLLANGYTAPQTVLEKQLALLWADLLHFDQIGIDDNFFDLGGNSLEVVRMVAAYRIRSGREIPAVKVFQYPTIAQLCRFLEDREDQQEPFLNVHGRAGKRSRPSGPETQGTVAIIGMVGRFPGAADLEQLWTNLCNQVESISFFAPDELGPGLSESVRNDPDYIRARGIVEGAELFDAGFFGISPLEAKIMDPQQRLFLELAHSALENAGYDPGRYQGLIGVYAGAGDNHYYTNNLLTHPDVLSMAGKLAVEYGNQKDYIALRAAFLLDLRGPAVSLNTACSTTLLAVDQAYRALLDYECDMALAGGVDITVPQKSGFPYTEGGTFAKDGHCRPFDENASGTMFCDGAGVVVLKRLEDAIADRDTVYAVLIGSGKNNNGARPASFLAPSVEGQAEAIAMAQARANVDVETIGYIEAHGTGTPVGDPIEVEALRSVFERKTRKKQFCYIGSLKGNIGHSTNAAGVAGLIKTAMVLHREQIPATLNFKKPNPRIDFANSPFMVADRLIPFPRGAAPRRAAVSSFGFGGTNVHAILEEAPHRRPGSKSRPLQLLPLSGRTASALREYGGLCAAHFDAVGEEDFADISYTLQTGRKQMTERQFVVAATAKEAAALLRQPNPLRTGRKRCERRDPPIVFLFGGQGTQYVNMGLSLYDGEPLFRAMVDHCCDILKPFLGRDLREVMYPQPGDESTARISLQDTFYTQPAVFVIEYALAHLWQSLGVRPAMMAGHSIGEFVAATLAGVWDLEDVLRIIASRGKLMQNLPRGSMMAVNLSAEKMAGLLPPTIQIASNNAPSLCVVAGPEPEVATLRAQLEANTVCRLLHTSHAFHSAMMDSIVEPLRAEIAKVNLRGPSKPIVSTVTGRLLSEEEAKNPAYWAHQARSTVEFSAAARTLKELGHDLYLECGPRSTLSSLIRQHFDPDQPCTAIPTFADTHENHTEWASMLFALGSLWSNGVSIDWDGFYVHEDRRRVSLPNYPFERQRHWIDPAPVRAVETAPPAARTAPETTRDTAPAESPRPAATAPQSRKERITARLLNVLVPISGHERGQLSASATFLEQGFDSLSLTQVALAIHQGFGVKLSFSQLMNQLPNVTTVAEHLDATMPADLIPTPQHVSATLKVASILSTTTVPQRGIFFSSRLSEHLSASYNESMMVRIKGDISAAKLERSLQKLVERHDALRASFDETGSTMRIVPESRLQVALTDFSRIEDPSTREDSLRKLAAEETARPFALPGGPLFRGQIVLLAPDSAAVVFTAHHVICDGWSLDVLTRDLCAFYSGEISGTPARLGPAPTFTSYTETVVRREHSSEFAQARTYWEKAFAGGFPALVLTADFPRSNGRRYRAKRLDRIIDPTLAGALRSLAAEHGWSLFTVILGAVSILLARISNQRQFVLALPAADQPVLGEPELVGHCVSLLPFLVNFQDGESASAYLTRTQKELGLAHEQSIFTLVSLLENLRLANPVRGFSLIPAGLTSVKRFRPNELPHQGFEVDYGANPKAFESFEWYLNAIEAEDRLELHCHYDVGLLKEDTVSGWLAILEGILHDAAADPEREVLELAQLKHPAKISTAEVFFAHSPGDERKTYANPLELTATDAVSVPAAAQESADYQESDILEVLLKLWKCVLARDPVGPDDDFFALGGHSMLAAQLFVSIERRLGITAPLAGLFDAATPRKLARLLATESAHRHWRTLVPINRGGNRPPLFLVHGAEGNVLLYRSLASHLGGDQPVYGLQSAGLDGETPVDDDFERVARRYVREIRQVQPEGPYLLGGYCLGGTIALEMARQLIEGGQRVGLMAMIENVNVRSIQWPLPWHLLWINRILNPYFHVRNLLAAKDRGIDFFLEKLHTEMTRLKVTARVAWARARRSYKRGKAEGFHHIKVAYVHEKALEKWDIRPYPGEITLFMSERRLAGMTAPLGGWEQIAREGVRLYSLPVYPKGSLIEPYVGQLAEQIRGCMDRAAEKAIRDKTTVTAFQ